MPTLSKASQMVQKELLGFGLILLFSNHNKPIRLHIKINLESQLSASGQLVRVRIFKPVAGITKHVQTRQQTSDYKL